MSIHRSIRYPCAVYTHAHAHAQAHAYTHVRANVRTHVHAHVHARVHTRALPADTTRQTDVEYMARLTGGSVDHS